MSDSSYVYRQKGWSGGLSFSKRVGQTDSYERGENIKVREDIHQISLQPKPVVEMETNGVPTVFADSRTDLFSFTSNGQILRKPLEGNEWSEIGQVSEPILSAEYYGEADKVFFSTKSSLGSVTRQADGTFLVQEDHLRTGDAAPTNNNSLILDKDSVLNMLVPITTGHLTLNGYFDTDGWLEKPKTLFEGSINAQDVSLVASPSDSYFGTTDVDGDGTDWLKAQSNINAQAGTNTVICDSVSGFSVGDRVFMVQTVSDFTDSTIPGTFEDARIVKITGKVIYLDRNLVNNYVNNFSKIEPPEGYSPNFGTIYTTPQKAMILSVREYRLLTAKDPISCKTWDGKLGGYVFLIAQKVQGNLDITVRNQGFRGGEGISLIADSTSAQGGQLVTSTGNTEIGYAGRGEGTGGCNYLYANKPGAPQQGAFIGRNSPNGSGGAGGISTSGGKGGSISSGNGGTQEDTAYSVIAPGGFSSNDVSDVKLCMGGGEGGSSLEHATVHGKRGGGCIFVAAGDLESGGLSIDIRGGSAGKAIIYSSSQEEKAVINALTEGDGGSDSICYFKRIPQSRGVTLTARVGDAKIFTPISASEWGGWQRLGFIFNWNTGDFSITKEGRILVIEKTPALTAGLTGTISLRVPGGDEGTKCDDIRLFDTFLSSEELAQYNNQTLSSTTPNLRGYYELENNLENSVNGTLATVTGTYLFSTDRAFFGVTGGSDYLWSQSGTGATYALNAFIQENANSLFSFTPAYTPLRQVTFFAATDMAATLIIHDANNNEIYRSEEKTASGSSQIDFLLEPHLELVRDVPYHLHLVGSGSLVAASANNLSTAQTSGHFALVTVQDTRPMLNFANMLCIGNGNVLSVMSPGEVYEQARLVFSKKLKITAITNWRSYLAIYTQKDGDLSSPSYKYLWNGSSLTYNAVSMIKEGGVTSAINWNDLILLTVGRRSDLVFDAGESIATFYRSFPSVGDRDDLEVSANALAVYDKTICIGVGKGSAKTERGIYSYGIAHQGSLNSLTLDYTSPRQRGVNQDIEVKSLHTCRDSLYAGVSVGGAGAIERVSYSNNYASDGYFESIIQNMGMETYKSFQTALSVSFLPLTPGTKVRLRYSLNAGVTWTFGDWVDQLNQTKTTLPVARWTNLMQFGVDLVSTGENTPVVTEIALATPTLTGGKKW